MCVQVSISLKLEVFFKVNTEINNSLITCGQRDREGEGNRGRGKRKEWLVTPWPLRAGRAINTLASALRTRNAGTRCYRWAAWDEMLMRRQRKSHNTPRNLWWMSIWHQHDSFLSVLVDHQHLRIFNLFIRAATYDKCVWFLWKFSFQNNHLAGRILIIKEKKFSPRPGIEPGSPALRTGVLINWATQMILNYWYTTYQMVILKAEFSSKLAYMCR